MTLASIGRASALAIIVPAVAVVVTLAVLQYRWTTEASEATAVRLADALQLSMINWQLDLFRNLSEVCLFLRSSPDADARGDLDEYASRLAEWTSIAKYPRLVAAVTVLETGGDGALRTWRLSDQRSAFEAVPPAPAFAQLGRELAAAAVASAPRESTGRAYVETFYDIGEALRDWRFASDRPALIRPLMPTPSEPPDGGDPGRSWLVVELDREVIRTRLLPDLAHRYFQGTDGLDYEVAVTSGTATRQVLYSSDAGFGTQDEVDADGRMGVFGRSSGNSSGRALYVFHKTSDNRGPATAAGTTWFPLLRPGDPEADWQLVVRHRRGGPLGAFIAETRRRDLAFGFGALLFLVASMTMLVITSHRAQRLGKLHVDFVAAVSHELRTPLTIIGSAADNLANGVVESPAQMQEYGTVIGAEVEHLSRLVEGILHFTAAREGFQRYSVTSVRVQDLIETTLNSARPLIRAAEFTVDCDIEPGLPDVTGDPAALARCLGNLVTNALKYGKEQRWLGVRACLVTTDHGRREVQMSISDRGVGIDPEDLPHVFEPFYRSESAKVAQIQGTGLGLAVARQIAVAMGGQLTVTSQPGRGSTFTLHLMCTEASPGADVARIEQSTPHSERA